MGNASPWLQYNFDVRANLAAGTTYRLRFADVSNVSPILMGVDNVSLDYTPASAVPELPSALLFFAALGFVRRRK